MNRPGCHALMSLLLAFGWPGLARAQDCPKGYVKIAETDRDVTCKLIGEKLPSVDPGGFVSDEERAFLRAQIAALNVKKRSFQDQLRALDRMRGQQEMYAQQIDRVAQQVMADASLHTLTILQEEVRALAGAGYIPAANLADIERAITVAQGAVQALSAAGADPADATRRIEKSIDAVFTFKNLIQVNEALIPAEQQRAFKRAMDTLPKMLKISERIARGERNGWSTYLSNLDDALDAAGQLLPGLKVLRGAAHILDAEAVLWLIRRDRGAIEEAFVQSSTAKRYYQNRIGEIDQLLSFYDERLKRRP